MGRTQVPLAEHDLVSYIDAGFPIMLIRTYDEKRADEQIRRAAARRRILEWNQADGIIDFVSRKTLSPDATSLVTALRQLEADTYLHHKVLVLRDAGDALDAESPRRSDEAIALLKSIARRIRRKDGLDASIILAEPSLNVPAVLTKDVTILELAALNEREIDNIIDRFTLAHHLPRCAAVLKHELTAALRGLSETEVVDLLSLAAAKYGHLSREALPLVLEQKKQIVLREGLLEMIEPRVTMQTIGGLKALREWLEDKRRVFVNWQNAQQFGVSTPKGVLIAGVPGCGKSLIAEAVGDLFGVPLLRLDIGRIMGQYLGQSEENLRRAISLAESIAPSVLWIDELEKAFSGMGSEKRGGSAHETTVRLFGTLLTWMQEKQSTTFVVATANDVTKLPPEFLRKGRFDEMFFVDLPKPYERKEIFETHLRRRRLQDADRINVARLVEKTDKYSGADIEGVVSDAIESAFVRGSKRLETEHILRAIERTTPLAKSMAPELEEMQKIFKKRKFREASK